MALLNEPYAIVIRRGIYDGITLIDGLTLVDAKQVVETIADRITNDEDLRHVVIMCMNPHNEFVSDLNE